LVKKSFIFFISNLFQLIFSPYAGDMLELWAVDLPELYHLNDVIVFSTRGERPDFNKIAGSDLDGDGYFVS